MFPFLLVLHAVIAAALVTVILMQRSEGGGLGMGGSPSGLMSARGAADFLTRATATLAALFVALSILLAVLAANHHVANVDTSLAKSGYAPPPAGGTATAPGAPAGTDPFASAAQRAAAAATGNGQAAAPAARGAPADNNAVPLAR